MTERCRFHTIDGRCPQAATGTMDFTTYQQRKGVEGRPPESYCDEHLAFMDVVYRRQGIWSHTNRHFVDQQAAEKGGEATWFARVETIITTDDLELPFD